MTLLGLHVRHKLDECEWRSLAWLLLPGDNNICALTPAEADCLNRELEPRGMVVLLEGDGQWMVVTIQRQVAHA